MGLRCFRAYKKLVPFLFIQSKEIKKFREEVYDKDSSSKKLKKHDFLGKCEGTIAEVVAAKHGKKVLQLTDMMKKQMYGSGKKSTLTITCEQMASTTEL